MENHAGDWTKNWDPHDKAHEAGKGCKTVENWTRMDTDDTDSLEVIFFFLGPNPDKPETRNPKQIRITKIKITKQKKLNGRSDPSEVWIDRDLQRW